MKIKIISYTVIFILLFILLSSVAASDNLTDEGSDLNKSSVQIHVQDKTSYTDYNDALTVKLTSNNTELVNKSIAVSLNNAKYNKTTDLKGQISINFKLKTGNYKLFLSFAGDDNYNPANATSTITVKSNLITYLNVVDKDINYMEGLKSIFQLKLTDIYKKTVKSKQVIIKVNGKTYSAKTNSNGIATFYLNLKKGTYNVEYSFSQSSNYLASSGVFKITVKSKIGKGNGYWVNKWDMKKVNLKKLSKLKTKQIFLQHTVFSKYGVKKVLKWIKKAHKYGMKVHIWMSVFYKNGKFIHPANKKGNYNYKYMDTILKQAKYYAGLGVDGIHFDYVRYGGNAYKYKNSVNAINYFVKKSAIALHKQKSDIIVSLAVMPEPTSMKHYYGQDTKTMSKYVDVIIPMIYKGNYHAKSTWIKKTTKKFTKQTNAALIWSGLQTYKSDSNIKKLSYKALYKDAVAAKKGGASGIVLFRWGLTKFLNFKGYLA